MAKRSEVPATAKTSHKLRIRIDDLLTFSPLTETQKHFFDLYKQGTKAILLHGVAGTGKTFIALYKALEEVLDRANALQQVVIVRSAVQSRDIGHLPGDEDEKTEVFKRPYEDICAMLFGGFPSAFQRLEEQSHVQFMTTSFIRGITIDNSVIIVDEAQNLNFQEINTIMTRVGEGSKIIFCGDFRQTDLNKKQDMSGLRDFMCISRKMPSFRNIEFGVDDICRSELVKEFILATMAFQDEQKEEAKQNARRTTKSRSIPNDDSRV